MADLNGRKYRMDEEIPSAACIDTRQDQHPCFPGLKLQKKNVQVFFILNHD